jgi:bifunctional non-homologous end joining protein LigD
MAEQLSLRLEPELPRLEYLVPMQPTAVAGPFDSPDHLFEPSWRGHRAIALVGPGVIAGSGDIRLLGEDGLDLAPRLPELAGLAVRVAARSAVLDGELVVVDASGRSDQAELERRLAGGAGRAVAYLVFDLLHLDGRWLLTMPLEKRRALLRKVLRPGDEVVVVPAIAREGLALHAAVVAQGLGGMLARERLSPYLPGVRSHLWRWIEAGSGPGGDEGTQVAAAEPASAAPGVVQGPGTGPVLAVFRRLPLEDEEPVGDELPHEG